MTLHRFAVIILPELYFLAGLLAGLVQGVLAALRPPYVKEPVPETNKSSAPAQQIASTKGVASLPPAVPATPEPQHNGPKVSAMTTPSDSAGDRIKPDGADEAKTVADADIDGALQAMWFGSTPESATGRAH